MVQRSALLKALIVYPGDVKNEKLVAVIIRFLNTTKRTCENGFRDCMRKHAVY